jgi:transposase
MIYQRLFYGRSYEEIALQLFVSSRTVYRTVSTFMNTGDVKPCRLGRPSGSITLFPHEEYIIMDCILQTPEIQLNEIANHIVKTTGSAFGPRTLCRALYRLGITRKKVLVAIYTFKKQKQNFMRLYTPI